MPRQAVLIANSAVAIDTQKSVTSARLRRNVDRLSVALSGLPEPYTFEISRVVDERPSVVRQKVNRAAERADRSNDLLLLYYFGHGSLSPDFELELIFPGAKGRTDHLPFAFLHGICASHGLQKTITVLDCCYAGAAQRTISFSHGTGHVLLASATATVRAHVHSDNLEPPIGAFTLAVLGGLASAEACVSNTVNDVTAASLFDYAKRETKRLTEDLQEPTFAGSLNETLFKYAKVPEIIHGATEWAKPKSGYGKISAICTALAAHGSFQQVGELYRELLHSHRDSLLTFYKESESEFKHLPAKPGMLERYLRFLRSIGVIHDHELTLTPVGRGLTASDGEYFNERLVQCIERYLAVYSLNTTKLEEAIRRVLGRREMPSLTEIADDLFNAGLRIPRSELSLVLDLLGYTGALRMSIRRVYFHW